MIIAFTGKKFSGKSTACDILKAKGYTEINFADPLKKLASELSGIPLADFYNPELKELEQKVNLGEIGGHTLFANSIRHALQYLGTDLYRSSNPNHWVDIFKASIDPAKDYVVGDTRFNNEVQAVRDLGGAVIEVKRPGLTNTDTHASEQQILSVDWTLHNTDLKLFKRDILLVEDLIRNGKKSRQEQR